MITRAWFARAPALAWAAASDTLGRRRWSWRVEWVTGSLLFCMIVGGAVLRMQGIRYPYQHTFDEHLYVAPAHHYLVGVPDLSDLHPPLGKLLIAVGMLLFGHNPVGWRFASLCFGLQTIVLAYLLTRELFQSPRAGWFAAAFVAVDGFFIAYSRTGLPDGVLTCLVLWSMLAAVTARGLGGVMLSAILVGAAASIKWSGLMAGLPAAVAVLVLRRARWYALAGFVLVPLVHWGIWVLGLGVMGHASDLRSLARVMHRFFKTHSELGHRANPLASPWYTWIFLYHPIVVKLSTWGIKSRYASSAGHPLLWVLGGLSVLGLPLGAAVHALVPRWRKRWTRWFAAPFTQRMLLLALGWLAMLMPWMVGRGIYTFWYHYLPSWAFALLLLAAVIAHAERRWPGLVLVLMLLVCSVTVYFAPVWAEFPMTVEAANRRLIFLPWRP
jgi:dolichyl-phosphate-mannose-protein mannosyltransferase